MTARPAGGSRPALVPVLVFLGMVVAVVSSLGAPLIPTIALVDHVSLAEAQWSLTITLVVGAVATPALGRLGDGPRRREVILGSLAVVVAGCVLAALPLGFLALVLGRALQGAGLGLTPLAIAVARDALAPDRARSAIALLSITTVAGVGLGYPLTGFVAQSFGVSAGFWFGAGVAALALLAAAAVVPTSRHRLPRRFDGRGALLLGCALAGLLLALSEAAAWGWFSARLLVVTGVAVAVLLGWVRHERTAPSPLIELRLVAQRGVFTADLVALLTGLTMYLLVSLVTRFVQTPASAGYGFGSSIVVTGLVLLPFSLASLSASRLTPILGRRAPAAVLPVGGLVLLLGALTFALVRHALWEVVVAMSVTGLGVGVIFAALPGLIVRAVPPEETGSAMSFNQVLRYVGYSAGSALSATVLAAHTPIGQRLPTGGGYELAGLVTVLAAAAAAGAGLPHWSGRTALRSRPDWGVRAGQPGQASGRTEASVADALVAEEPTG